MKKINYLLFSLLAISLVSCNNSNNGDSNQDNENKEIEYVEDIERLTFDGVHEFDVKETDNYIVRGKASNYTIVMPSVADSYLVTAKEELKTLFFEATGVSLFEETEDAIGFTHNENNEYISLGNTKLFESANLGIDASELKSQTARIKTKDKTVYVYGGDSSGVLFAVYDLLEIYFNFDAFSYDCINLDKKDDLKFYDIDILDVPDIPMRTNAWASIKENPNNLANRLRTPLDFSDYCLSVGDTSCGVTPGAIHNSLLIIPKNSPLGIIYKDDWFSDAGDQICYTCHGNEEAYNALVNQSALIIEQGLQRYTPASYPLKNIVTFTMMDNQDICTCRHCAEAKERYGAASGAVIKFCNDLMAKIHDWMELPSNEAYKRPDLKLVFFAYNGFILAPAHYDEAAKKYVPNHDDVKMRDDVGVYYAVSSGFNFQQNIYDDHNKEGMETYKQWCEIAPTTLLWTYNANFGAYLSHVNSTNFYNNDAYQAFANGGVKLIYNQGAWNSYNLTAFQMLAIYLDAKLSWNSNADMNALIDKWFDGMYKEASEDMKKLFYLENTYSMIIYEKVGALANTGIINVPVQKEDCYPFQLLKSWLNIIDEAREKIEVYKEIDMTTYKIIKEHIDLEWVSPAYFMLALYGADYMSVDEYNSMINYFIENILPLKQFIISERSGSLSTWITELASGK